MSTHVPSMNTSAAMTSGTVGNVIGETPPLVGPDIQPDGQSLKRAATLAAIPTIAHSSHTIQQTKLAAVVNVVLIRRNLDTPILGRSSGMNWYS